MSLIDTMDMRKDAEIIESCTVFMIVGRQYKILEPGHSHDGLVGTLEFYIGAERRAWLSVDGETVAACTLNLQLIK